MRKQKKAIIIGNGKAPKIKELDFFIKEGFSFIVAADGGANTAFKLGLIPDLVIGDFDSIREDVLEYFSDKTELKQIKRQSDTDIEKGIKFLIRKKFSDAVLLGASGNRLDHTFCNIGNILKYKGKINIHLFHEKTIATVYEKSVRLKTKVGETISIYGIDNKTFISTSGLKYPLKNETLPFGVRGGTSNEAVADEVLIEISGGKVIVMREFSLLRKNALLRFI